MREMKKKKVFGFKMGEAIALVSVYIFLALLYYVTLYGSMMGYEKADREFFSLIRLIDLSGLDYAIKFILTLPILYLLFVKLKDWSLKKMFLLHLVLLPVFVLTWQRLYYWFSEILGLSHLEGSGSVWDLYIPCLFYILQFGLLHSYVYYKENQKKIILEGELRNMALKSELSALKAQLNPHFLYNIFNTINAAVHPDNEKARNMIAELSDLFRYQLKASQTDRVPLREELEFLRKYLDLEKERFGDRLNVTIDVEESILGDMIPPMLLQPLVENSIKHGLSSLLEGGTISIIIFKKVGKLHFEIADNGVGISDKSAVFEKGVGLTNTKMRLEKIYNASLNLSDNNPKGLKISFAI